MNRSLRDKHVLLGVTGSVAAYKSVDIVKSLIEKGASVNVMMTEASSRFVTPLTLKIASGGKVLCGLFDDPLSHISIARDADLLLVAPATANIIGKFATGVADDLLSTAYLAYRGKVVIAPAMNWRMYEHPTVRRNLSYLDALGVVEVSPVTGALACGEEGRGRMAEPDDIVEAACAALSPRDMDGERVVVSAGPTREHMDDVRFITNASTGRMGYALARIARRRGAEVTLISGPTELPTPPGVELVRVSSATGMRAAVIKSIKQATVLVMAAAVSDFLPEKKLAGKPPKSTVSTVKLVAAPDILAEVGKKRKRPLLVGFSAEIGDNTARARAKLSRKGADIIVFNDITVEGSGFGTETNQVVIIDSDGSVRYPVLHKEEVAEIIMDRVALALKT